MLLPAPNINRRRPYSQKGSNLRRRPYKSPALTTELREPRMFSFLPEQQTRKDSNPRLWFWRPPFSPTKLRTYESVGIAGFEPTISSTPSRRITKLSHIPNATVFEDTCCGDHVAPVSGDQPGEPTRTHLSVRERLGWCCASQQGFEPRYPRSERGVMPLDHWEKAGRRETD